MKKQELKEMVAKAKKMYANGEYQNPEYGEMCMTVVKLIERSKFGETNAEAELVLKPNRSNWLDQMLDGSFDGAIMQLLQIANSCLREYGQVTADPYSSGLTTRSAKVSFTKKGN